MHTLIALLAALLLTPTLAAEPPEAMDAAPVMVAAADKAGEKAATGKKPSTPKAAAGNKAPQPKAASGKKDTPPKAAAGKKPADKPAKATGKASAEKPAAGKKAQAPARGRLADFGKVAAPEDVVHVANWATYTGNHGKRAFVVIDKKKARLYVFDPRGKLRSSAPILLGKAIGDDTAPGVGSKTLAQLAEEEKTTPAGRFLAKAGVNNHGEDILWIDYDSAVSMHRMRPVDPKERRAHRMATPTPDDNRISNGCVNVPHKFYDSVLKPTVMRHGAIIYVLPETRPVTQQFASFDVLEKEAKVQVAQASADEGKAAR